MCGNPLDPVLAGLGDTTHAMCDPMTSPQTAGQHIRHDMTESSEIRAGDKVTLRSSDPPKVGQVLTIVNRSADWLPGDFPAGQVPDVLAVVARQGETRPVAERPADLIKL